MSNTRAHDLELINEQQAVLAVDPLIMLCSRRFALDRETYTQHITWLFSTAAACRCSRPTVYAAKSILDRVLHKLATKEGEEQAAGLVQDLALPDLVATAFWMATKLEEVRAPSMEYMTQISGMAPQSLVVAEAYVCSALDWNLTPNYSPINFIHLFAQRLQRRLSEPKGSRIIELIHPTMHLVDVAVMSPDSLAFSNSVLACTALAHVISREPDISVHDADLHFASGLAREHLVSCTRWFENNVFGSTSSNLASGPHGFQRPEANAQCKMMNMV